MWRRSCFQRVSRCRHCRCCIEPLSRASSALNLLTPLSPLSPLFPADALEFYSKFNLLQLDPDHNPRDAELHRAWYTPARGGGQGDYREGIREKVANVVDCLRRFPYSKRAVVTIPHTHAGSITADHTVTDEAKCLRELHFYIEGEGAERRLCATGCMRAQAASIFPKNIHFIGSMMHDIARQLGDGIRVGSYTHQVTTLVDVR